MQTSTAAALDMRLAFESRELLQFLNGRMPTREEILELTREKGFEYATRFLHRAILQSPMHGEFIRHVQALTLQTRDVDRHAPIEVAIVPSVSWGARLSWGGHCEWIRKLARSLGFTTDVIDTRETESITGNARIIGQHLAETKASRLVLVTYGRGTSELRLLMQKRGKDAPEFRNVRAWINVGGSFHGLRLADLLLAKKLDRWEARFDFWLHRRKFEALQELATSFPLWRERLVIPDRMMMTSVVGLPLRDQVPVYMSKNFEKLSAYGPNDGIVPAIDTMVHPGFIYPVAGMSHQADEFIFRPVLGRLLMAVERVIRDVDARRTSQASPRIDPTESRVSRTDAPLELL